MTSSSRMLYYTTTSWMMWHWSVSALAVGASLVLYTGSPFRPQGHLSLPKLLSSLKVTHFGTSAAYLTALEANNVLPLQDPSIDLSSLEAIYSTASPLPPSTFAYVYTAFPKRINLASITGGTDIISLFGAPCPLLPVRAGQVQCVGLGMAVGVFDPLSDPESPREVAPGEPGDLVCVRPFPCQPLTFFGPGGDEKYRAAYFERFPGIWHHGDFVRLDPVTGGLTMVRPSAVCITSCKGGLGNTGQAFHLTFTPCFSGVLFVLEKLTARSWTAGEVGRRAQTCGRAIRIRRDLQRACALPSSRGGGRPLRGPPEGGGCRRDGLPFRGHDVREGVRRRDAPEDTDGDPDGAQPAASAGSDRRGRRGNPQDGEWEEVSLLAIAGECRANGGQGSRSRSSRSSQE